jgi:hypothetical protein
MNSFVKFTNLNQIYLTKKKRFVPPGSLPANEVATENDTSETDSRFAISASDFTFSGFQPQKLPSA